jgi:hypothetical protein
MVIKLRKQKMENDNVKVDPNMNLWRTVFLGMVLAGMTLIISLSIFFYIRAREPLWDNRSGVSRLVVVNQSSNKRFGTETFTMFGSEEITLTGEPISDETTLFIGDGGVLLMEVSGLSRGETDGSVSTYSSKFKVSRKDVTGITPLDATGTQINAEEISLAPIDGTDGAIVMKLAGSRVEIRGQWDTVANLVRDYAIRVEVLGWYP